VSAYLYVDTSETHAPSADARRDSKRLSDLVCTGWWIRLKSVYTRVVPYNTKADPAYGGRRRRSWVLPRRDCRARRIGLKTTSRCAHTALVLYFMLYMAVAMTHIGTCSVQFSCSIYYRLRGNDLGSKTLRIHATSYCAYNRVRIYYVLELIIIIVRAPIREFNLHQNKNKNIVSNNFHQPLVLLSRRCPPSEISVFLVVNYVILYFAPIV